MVTTASECERLVVGETYLVPCINGRPVIGDPHIDDDHFNHTENHYHCDSRFFDDSTLGGPANCAVYANQGPPKLEPRVCVRTTPSHFEDEVLAMCRMALYADYGFTESKCGRCAHRGMPIINGVCSGHRLEWLPDGTIKYKPPYTLQIRGTNNKLVISERHEQGGFRIPICDPFDGLVYVDMYDREGHQIAGRKFDRLILRVGDSLHITDQPMRPVVIYSDRTYP